ncbi:hypothetical protein [Luteimonas sp. e5]
MTKMINEASSSQRDLDTAARHVADKLKALQPNAQHRKNQLFELLYPTIVEMLGQKVTQKAILEVLASEGLKLHPARFKELMSAEAKKLSRHSGATEGVK